MSNESKRSYAKIAAMAASLTLHLAGIYYLGTVALDYALPEGSVDSMEVSYDINQGVQVEATDVSVIDTPAQVATTPKQVVPPPVKPSTPAPKAAPLPTALPSKEVVAEQPQEIVQEESPVVAPLSPPEETNTPTSESYEDLIKDTFENDKTAEPVLEPQAPVEAAAAAAVDSPAQTSQPYGRPDGVQSDRVLTPLPGNRGITYPTMARLRRLEGTTLVHYTVSAEGLVTDVKVVQSSGSSVLDNQAVDSIKTWKFKPTGESGVYERPIRFKLSGDAQEAPSKLRRLNN